MHSEGGNFVRDGEEPMRYRSRVYSSYGRNFQDMGEQFDYERARDWGRAQAYHLREWLPIDKSADIIDLGCGGGRLLSFLRDRGYENLTGVDISPDQVALARQVTLNVMQGDLLSHLDRSMSAYDLIVCFDIIEHLHKDEVLRFLDGCFSALRPGGRVILQTPNADSPMLGALRYGDFSHEVAFNANSLSRLMQMVGFSELSAREAGPVPRGYSVRSSVRYIIWRMIRAGLLLWNLAETGARGDGVLTRVFLISGVKKPR